MILHNPPNEMIIRYTLSNASPASTSIAADQQIGSEVSVLVIIQGHVNRIGIVQIGANIVHECGVGHTGQITDLNARPGTSTVISDLNQTVIGTGIEQILVERRLCQRRDGVVVGHRRHIP